MYNHIIFWKRWLHFFTPIGVLTEIINYSYGISDYGVFADVQKAFDTVDHPILLKKNLSIMESTEILKNRKLLPQNRKQIFDKWI